MGRRKPRTVCTLFLTYNTIQYNIILLKKLSGRSLTRIKLHVVVTSDQ